jgi:hypothetical protein
LPFDPSLHPLHVDHDVTVRCATVLPILDPYTFLDLAADSLLAVAALGAELRDQDVA